MKLGLFVLCCVLVLAGVGAAFGEQIFFVQLSDTHWGFDNPKVNPDYAGTLKKAIAQVNALPATPDFIVFTGDETHTTNDPAVRRQRMTEFKAMVGTLKVQDIHYLPGEHDAGLDAAAAYQEFFGPRYYTFDLKGLHFVALDNVTAGDSLGDAQLAWLGETLGTFDKDSQIIVFAHRPLLEVYSQWDWRTKDGDKALALLKPFRNVKLFYGHIHQEREDTDGSFTQYAAKGMMFPLPAPGSVAKPGPVPWDPQHPYQGLGFRTVRIDTATREVTVIEYPIAASTGVSVSIQARLGEFDPDVIRLKKGVPVTLELSSLDTTHGFSCPDLGIDATLVPGSPVVVPVLAAASGEHDFFCSVFCGEGHENMIGKIIVE
ncbi:MAG TPA: cupredoxin domain-containing protein [Spirochaetia bacterium]|nr:cupredoxin domain-containing protein [Spirochaetia bacterium]